MALSDSGNVAAGNGNFGGNVAAGADNRPSPLRKRPEVPDYLRSGRRPRFWPVLATILLAGALVTAIVLAAGVDNVKTALHSLTGGKKEAVAQSDDAAKAKHVGPTEETDHQIPPAQSVEKGQLPNDGGSKTPLPPPAAGVKTAIAPSATVPPTTVPPTTVPPTTVPPTKVPQTTLVPAPAIVHPNPAPGSIAPGDRRSRRLGIGSAAVAAQPVLRARFGSCSPRRGGSPCTGRAERGGAGCVGWPVDRRVDRRSGSAAAAGGWEIGLAASDGGRGVRRGRQALTLPHFARRSPSLTI